MKQSFKKILQDEINSNYPNLDTRFTQKLSEKIANKIEGKKAFTFSQLFKNLSYKIGGIILFTALFLLLYITYSFNNPDSKISPSEKVNALERIESVYEQLQRNSIIIYEKTTTQQNIYEGENSLKEKYFEKINESWIDKDSNLLKYSYYQNNNNSEDYYLCDQNDVIWKYFGESQTLTKSINSSGSSSCTASILALDHVSKFLNNNQFIVFQENDMEIIYRIDYPDSHPIRFNVKYDSTYDLLYFNKADYYINKVETFFTSNQQDYLMNRTLIETKIIPRTSENLQNIFIFDWNLPLDTKIDDQTLTMNFKEN